MSECWAVEETKGSPFAPSRVASLVIREVQSHTPLEAHDLSILSVIPLLYLQQVEWCQAGDSLQNGQDSRGPRLKRVGLVEELVSPVLVLEDNEGFISQIKMAVYDCLADLGFGCVKVDNKS